MGHSYTEFGVAGGGARGWGFGRGVPPNRPSTPPSQLLLVPDGLFKEPLCEDNTIFLISKWYFSELV